MAYAIAAFTDEPGTTSAANVAIRVTLTRADSLLRHRLTGANLVRADPGREAVLELCGLFRAGARVAEAERGIAPRRATAGTVGHTVAGDRHRRLTRDRRTDGIAIDVEAGEIDPHTILCPARGTGVTESAARGGRRERSRSAHLAQGRARLTDRGGGTATEELNELLPVERRARANRRRGDSLRGLLFQLGRVRVRVLAAPILGIIGAPRAAHRGSHDQARQK